MKHIVTGLEKKTVLLWHPDSPTSIELDQPHIIPSKALSEKTSTGKSASDVRKALQAKGIEFTERKLTRNKVIIQAIGPPEMKKDMSDLEDEFPCIRKNDGRNNISQLRKMRTGWPFCYAELDDGKPIFTKQMPSIDELCDLPFDAFDSEFEGWEREIDFDDLDVSEDAMREYLQVEGMTKKEACERAVRLQTLGKRSSGPTAAQAALPKKKDKVEPEVEVEPGVKVKPKVEPKVEEKKEEVKPVTKIRPKRSRRRSRRK